MTNKDWRRKLEALLRDNAHYPEKIFVEEALELCIPLVESLLEQERKAAKKELIEELKEIAKDKKFSSEETDITAGWNMGIDKLLNEACKITKSKVQTYNLDPDI